MHFRKVMPCVQSTEDVAGCMTCMERVYMYILYQTYFLAVPLRCQIEQNMYELCKSSTNRYYNVIILHFALFSNIIYCYFISIIIHTMMSSSIIIHHHAFIITYTYIHTATSKRVSNDDHDCDTTCMCTTVRIRDLQQHWNRTTGITLPGRTT